MEKFKLIILLLILSITAEAQTETSSTPVASKNFKATEIKVENYTITKVITAYDLALNLSYCHHISQGFDGEYLILPIISINDKPVDENLLKGINISDILDFQFDSGLKTTALYGARGQYGHLILYLKDEGLNK